MRIGWQANVDVLLNHPSVSRQHAEVLLTREGWTVRDNVILRQIPLYPGQTLTYPDLRLGEKNLARLNIFEMKPDQGIKPTLSVLDPDSPTEYKDILVRVGGRRIRARHHLGQLASHDRVTPRTGRT